MNHDKQTFFNILKDNTYGVCPAPTDSKIAMQVLTDYLLGEDWYIPMSLSPGQATTCIVDSILSKYSKQYRKDKKLEEKKLGDNNGTILYRKR